MTAKLKEDRLEKILEALRNAASGDYSTKLEFASKDDGLGLVAEGVNKLLKRLGKASAGRAPSAPVIDILSYRDMLDSLQESNFEVDLNGKLVFFTDRVMSRLGYSKQELRKIHFKQLLDDFNIKKVLGAFESVYLTGQPVQGLECEIIKKDQEKIDIECSITLIKDEAGKPSGFRGVVRDVSARKQAERALKQSEEKYRNILENMDEIYVETDLDGRYVFFNNSACRALGYTREELQGMNYRQINPPGVHGRVFEKFNEIYRTGKTGTFIAHAVRCKDGSTRFLETTVSLRRSPSGEPVGFAVVSRDLTEKLEADRKIKDSEKHLRFIADNVRDMIWTMDFDMNLTYVSPSVSRILGFSPEEIMKAPLQAILPPESYAEVERRVAEGLAESRALPDEEIAVRVELPILRKDGSQIWVEISAAINRDENGRPFEIVGVTRDISERKKAEEALRKNEKRYRMLAENVNDVVWIIGLDLSFKYASPSQVKVLGWTPEKAINITVRDVVAPESLERISGAMAEELALEAGGGPFDPNRSRTIEIEAYAQDGRSVWLELTGTFNRDAEGKPTEILAVGRNITQRKLVEQALAESEKRYRMMAENVNDVVWVIGLDLQLKYASPSTVKVTGYTSEEAMALSIEDVATPESVAAAYRIVAEELAREESENSIDPNRSMTIEVEAYAKSGDKYWLEITGTFNRDADGRPTEILAVGRNITQRKTIERVLAESEKRYRMMAENIHDVVWVIGLDLKLKYVSPSNVKAAGYTPEEAMSLPLTDLVVPESLENGIRIVAEELALEASGKADPHRSRTVEIEAYAKGGQTIWLEVTGTFNRDANGKATEILAVGRNITQRKMFETALAESEKRYRMIAENMNDIIWTVGLDLQFRYVSPSSTRVTGYTPDETRRTPLNRLLNPASFSHATSRLAEELALETSGKPFDPNRAITIEVEAVRKDGSTYWLEIAGTFNRDRTGAITEILVVGRDITARKTTEKALEETRNRYRMIVENMHDSISLLDLNFNYLYVSPSEVRITGYQPEELMRIPPQAQTTPEYYSLMESMFLEEMEREYGGEPVDPDRSRTLEIEVYHKNGGKIWVELIFKFSRDEEGKPTGIMISARDITERRKIQEALRESEQRYRIIVEHMHDSILLMDLNFNYLYVSPSEVRVTGFVPEEMMKMELKDQLPPKSCRYVEKTVAKALAREFSGEPIDYSRFHTMVVEAYHKDGHTFWEELTTTFTRDENGKPTGILIIARDVTEQRKVQGELSESERRYRSIVENIKEIIWMTDLELKTTYVSPTCEWMLGYTQEEARQVPLDRLVTEESFGRAMQVFQEELALESAGDGVDPFRSRIIEQDVRRKDGTGIRLEVTATFTRDNQGKAMGLLLAGRDITERKKAEEEKLNLEKQLMQAQKMETVGRLAGGVAHDFNNMLSVILGYVDLAKRRLAKQHPVLKDIAEIEKAAARSRDLTTQLLAFSRKQIIEPRIIDLNELAADTKKALTRLIGEDIHLSYHPGENLWAIKFDPSQIEQILINLAINARDAMPEGGKLTIETTNVTLDDAYCETHAGFRAGSYVRLAVSDNGIGMKKEMLECIFEPFFTTKDPDKGTGLGLATVYGIVKQNEGFINVYSEPGQGTTFAIYLPRTTEEKEIREEPEEQIVMNGTGHVLLVEDDPMVLQITKEMLESLGYTVTVTETPLEAIAICREGKPIDLVLTDVVMPVMKGKELRDKLVEIRPDIKVLFMSGYTSNVIAEHGVLEEGVQLLQKPFSITDLGRKVRDAMK